VSRKLHAKLSTEEAARRIGFCRPPTSLEVLVLADGEVVITTRGKVQFDSTYASWLENMRRLARELPGEVTLVEDLL
jgi:hypothetical protein